MGFGQAGIEDFVQGVESGYMLIQACGLGVGRLQKRRGQNCTGGLLLGSVA